MVHNLTQVFHEDSEISFADFVLKCATAILWEDPLPETFTVNSRLAPEIVALMTRIEEVENWSDEYSANVAKEFCQNRVSQNEQEVERKIAVKERFEEMLSQVYAWSPPSSEHENLKAYMVYQLRDGIEFDCNVADLPPIIHRIGQMSGAEYKAHLLEQLSEELEEKKQIYSEAVKEANRKTRYLQALRASLAKHQVD